MTRRKTDGERIAYKTWDRVYLHHADATWDEKLAFDIDRLLRKRMAEAWEDGWLDQYNDRRRLNENPYRGRAKK